MHCIYLIWYLYWGRYWLISFTAVTVGTILHANANANSNDDYVHALDVDICAADTVAGDDTTKY